MLGLVLRNHSYQARRQRLQALQYLDLGCGPNTHRDFINIDYHWHPGVDICWDIRKRLPFPDGRFSGIFTEHCLEHFPLSTTRAILAEAKRALAKNGRIRIVVPDAELYLRTYVAQLDGAASCDFPFQQRERSVPLYTPLWSVNRVWYYERESLFGHRWMYDFQQLARLLGDIGYRDVTKCRFGEGVMTKLILDTPKRSVESLYVEAIA